MTIKSQVFTSTTQASAAAAGNAVFDAFKTLVVSHPNWSLVEDTASVGSGGYRWICFKCDHTLSGLPNDVYVVFVSQAGTGFNAFAGESYTTATHTLTNPAFALTSQTSSFAINSSGLFSTTQTIAANVSTGAPVAAGVTASLLLSQATLNATTAFWQGYVYDDHLVFAASPTQAGMASLSTTSTVIAGGYSSQVPSAGTNDPVRVYLEYPNGSSTSAAWAAFSREPLQFASTTRFNPCSSYARNVASGNIPDFDYARGGSAFTSNADLIQANYPVARKLLHTASNVTANNYSTGAWLSLRGVLNNAFISNQAGNISGISPGDTISYGGTSWAYLGNALFTDTGA